MRRRTLHLVLVSLALSACENSGGEVTTTSTSELSTGGQVLCQSGGCDVHSAAVKIQNTNNGRTLSGAFCSGTVISTNRVLTSGKCLMDNNFSPRKVCITNRIQNSRCDAEAPVSELYYVRNMFIHPSFTGVVGNGFDAAVVEVDRPIMPFDNVLGTITPLPIDDQAFATGTQGTDFGFGANSNTNLSGQKQVRSDIPSVASSFPNYMAFATASVAFGAGDFGGGLIGPTNKVAGINSFGSGGVSLTTRTQPIRSWINGPTFASLPSCNVSSYKRIQSVVTGTCLEASGSTVSLKYCECKDAQLWLTSFGNIINRGNNGYLSSGAAGSAPTISFGTATATTSMWLIVAGNRTWQLTNNSGPTLITSTMNTPIMGGSNSPMKLWDLK